MATSNVQLQYIQQQLSSLGVPNVAQLTIIQNQIVAIQNQLASIDKTNTVLYSNTLERLYNMQSRLATSNTEQVQQLLTQKVELLKILTGN
jgi:hypothetical protein